MDIAILISVLLTLLTLLLVIVGIHELILQHGKHFSYVVTINEPYDNKITLSLRNGTPHKCIIDKICVYAHGIETNLEVSNGKKRLDPPFVIGGNSKHEIEIEESNLINLHATILNQIKKSDNSFFSILRGKMFKNRSQFEHYSYKLLIKSSGGIYITRKWIPTETVVHTIKMRKECNNNEEENLNNNDLWPAFKRMFKVKEVEVRTLREAGSFRRRRIDPGDQDGYISNITTITVAFLFVFSLIPYRDFSTNVALLLIIVALLLIVAAHRASTGIVKMRDKIVIFVMMWYTLLFLFISVNGDLLTSIVAGLFCSIPLSAIGFFMLKRFSGRDSNLIYRLVKK